MSYFFKLSYLLKKNNLPEKILDTAISNCLNSMEKQHRHNALIRFDICIVLSKRKF